MNLRTRCFLVPSVAATIAFVGASICACGGGSAPTTPAPAVTAPAPPVAMASPLPATRPPPVPAAHRPVTHDYWGTHVTDDFEWLEDGKSAEVSAFTDAQNAHARSVLDGLAERAPVRTRVAQLLGASSADYLAIKPRAGSLFVFVAQPPKQQAVLVMRAESGEASTEKVVLDPNLRDPSGKTTIDFFVPSPDKKLVALSLSKNGSESGDVHVIDVATGKDQPDVIRGVQGGTAGGSVAWSSDGTGLFYTRYPHAGERAEADLDFYQQVYFHKLGTPEAKDAYVIGKDFPRIAETELERSDDGKYVLVHVANGDGGEYAHHVVKASGAAPEGTRLSNFPDELVFTTFAPDGKIWGISRNGAPRGKVVVFTPPYDKPAETFLPEGDGVLEDLVVTKTALYLVELVGGPSRMRRIPLGVKPEPLAQAASKPKKGAATPAGPQTIAAGSRGVAVAELPIPAVSSITSTVSVGDDLLIRIESYTEPPAWYRYRAGEHRLIKTSMAKAAPADMSDIEVLRESCTSKDGMKVPVSILRRRGTKLDGSNPALLTGYGGFGVSIKPRLRPWYRAWLEQGGVLAQANLRGGGEMGATWHDAGKLTKKQNVFDDFAACAKTLFDLGYTKPERLGITGRSNGGLLMGAEIVQHPEMFRAVVSGVGIYDMLRVELHPNGAFNVTEFGTVKDETQFNAMRAYSPLHNVKDGTAYPAVLFMTGANDPRVDPYQSRKMTARLQAATSSERPILLRASADVGHGMGSPLGAEIEETTDLLTFFFHELSVPVTQR
jgi:prolyl oligopeptidase